MSYRGLLVILVVMSLPAHAQISRDAKYELLRTVLADTAAARMPLPFGSDGVEVSDSGEVNKDKVAREIQKNGLAIETGKVVTVTAISFDDDKVNLELDGGGKNKKSGILDRIQVGVGTNTTQVPVSPNDNTAKAKGSRIVVRFAKKVPADLKPAQLREILSPILDFEKRTFMKTGVESLPAEFQEAVKAKEARIGMDKSTVILAMGRPNDRIRETKNGAPTETWIYKLRGQRTVFVEFADNVVVEIKQYQ
jgi:hypothetical protein